MMTTYTAEPICERQGCSQGSFHTHALHICMITAGRRLQCPNAPCVRRRGVTGLCNGPGQDAKNYHDQYPGQRCSRHAG